MTQALDVQMYTKRGQQLNSTIAIASHGLPE